MYKAFGIVNSSSKNIRVEGLEDYRPIGAFSFLGRYRVIDFPISNLSNSDIDRIQIYVQEKPHFFQRENRCCSVETALRDASAPGSGDFSSVPDRYFL